MTEHGDLLRRYLTAFACGQLDVVAGLLTDDVTWELNGTPQTTTAADLIARQSADLAAGTPDTEVQSLYVSADGAAYVGFTTFTDPARRATSRARACETITVRDGRIARLTTLLTPCA